MRSPVEATIAASRVAGAVSVLAAGIILRHKDLRADHNFVLLFVASVFAGVFVLAFLGRMAGLKTQEEAPLTDLSSSRAGRMLIRVLFAVAMALALALTYTCF